ncbi:DEAD/DEAH box ATP-dependent RNA helicase [Plasmodium brasilianum]|uniref:DEAD/DEAH box ATP-dependent RNA helicase n=1 Tax=Plasmodium brasilianum TaxID=5824 RepID=A0ACB9Y2T9_PLABR|nr:DEAD/DEAH box ATP-dependent RNA helicase [Plasmodium brasilianum]
MNGQNKLDAVYTTFENCEHNNTPIEFSEKRILTNKEKRKLEYEERIRKKKEKHLKKVKKVITKSNITSLNGIKSNLIIDSTPFPHETGEQTNTILKKKDEPELDSTNNVNISNKKDLRDNLNESDKNHNREKYFREQPMEKEKNKYKKLCSMKNVSRKKLMKKLKFQLKESKEQEKEILFKKLQQYKLKLNHRNYMIPFNKTKNIDKNNKDLERLFQAYEEMKIDLPNNLKMIKRKLDKKKKKFLESKQKKELENNIQEEEEEEEEEKDERETKIKMGEKLNNYVQNENDVIYHSGQQDGNKKTVISDAEVVTVSNCSEGKTFLNLEDTFSDEISSDDGLIQQKDMQGDKNEEIEKRKENCKENYKDGIEIYENKRKVIYECVSVNRKENIEKMRLSLPVLGYEQEIIEAILNYDVVFINGDTGCGKSTQIPQFVYEHGFCSNNYLIGITEPRKIAVKSISNRLNEELNTDDISGYQIRFEKSNFLKNSKIKVMTEGILLKEIINDFILSKYSVIILDEAHERSINMDLILGLLSIICKIRKKNYFTHESDIIPIKVIIMSATINDSSFFENKIFENYTSINIPTEKVPVVDHFLSYTPKNYIEEAKKKIIQVHKKLPPGSILVFLTSQEEIYRLYNILSNLKISKESTENSNFYEFNAEKNYGLNDDTHLFDLSEEENNMNDKSSFFIRDTDENKEKKIIFLDSDDDESVCSTINALDITDQSVNYEQNSSEKKLENIITKQLSTWEDYPIEQEEQKYKACNKNKNQQSELYNEIEVHNLGTLKNGTIANCCGKSDIQKRNIVEDGDNDYREDRNCENDYKKGEEKDESRDEDQEEDEDRYEEQEEDDDSCEEKEEEDVSNEEQEEDDDGCKEHEKDHDKIIENEEKENSGTKQNEGSDGSGKLKIFKLYANLPMNEQMLLFNNPKDNERICILSTNIAETSITLPNIRYIVDCGKEKRKIYSTLNDYSYYIIDNISKSSSLQRKGRAGRILHLLKKNKKNKKKIEMEKGHVYKLYSSNYYNYFFKNHNDCPILNYPLDSLILYLLSFKIKNVENFPFINKPDKCKFEEAKKRLIYLNCIYFLYEDIKFLFKNVDDKVASRKSIENHIKIFNPEHKSGITLTGSFILSLPISTRYAKILTDVCLKSLAINQTSSIPLACLLVSCLYMESIFSYDYKLSVRFGKKEKKKKGNNSSNDIGNIGNVGSNDNYDNGRNKSNNINNNLMNIFFKKNNDEVNQDELSSCSSESSYCENTFSPENYDNNMNSNVLEDFKLKFDNDIDFYLNLCTSFYFADDKNNFCYIMHLDKKKMDELLKLSNYLIKIINVKLNTSINFDILEKAPSELSRRIIHYSVVQGFIDHFAIRSDLIRNDYTRNSNLSFNNKKAYFTQNMKSPVYINSTSVLYKNRPYPKYILYNYIMKNKKSYVMYDCLNINDSDLGKITNVCIYINGYEKIPPAKYDIQNDKIIVCVKPFYLPCSQYLPITTKELSENDFLFYNYLAFFILDGSMFPKMSNFKIFYSHSFNDIINCNHQNFKHFINALRSNKINNRAALISKWKTQNNFLKKEFLSLIERKFNKCNQRLINDFWPPLDSTKIGIGV